MAVHTCPRCELRFALDAEVREHLVLDHQLDPDAIRPHPLGAPGTEPRSIVAVIGNHTLLSDALKERLLALAAAGPTEVHVIVPVQHDSEMDIGYWRGRALAEQVTAPGLDFTVDVGVGDPVALLERSVEGHHVDRVLLSTLPASLSRWLQADLAGRLHHALGTADVPVEVVTAEG